MDRHRRSEPDPFLEWKVRIFFGGAVLLMAGILLQRDVLALLAAALLAVGAVMIVIARVRERRRDPSQPVFGDEDQSG